MFWTEIPLGGHTYLYVFPRGGIMAARHHIMEPTVSPHACAIGDAFILMLYNARARAAQVPMTFIGDTDLSVMNWPARSPDINPAEHTWGILSRQFQQRPHHPENEQDLVDALVQELQAIQLNGIMSMIHCCQEYVNDKGGQTSFFGERMC